MLNILSEYSFKNICQAAREALLLNLSLQKFQVADVKLWLDQTSLQLISCKCSKRFQKMSGYCNINKIA